VQIFDEMDEEWQGLIHQRRNIARLEPVSRRASMFAQMLRITRRCDGEIDLSGIPEIQKIPPDSVIGRFYRPKKASVTIRIDADVLAWLKAAGKGYRTRINDYLRRLMRQSRKR